MSELDPLAVSLTGRTLIEASAGTGKTYSIVALYLRAIVGHGLPRPLGVGEVSVVTFTNAASQELVSRIRDGLVAAEAAFSTGHTADALLARLLADTADHDGARKRLTLARQRLDEAAVDTIHGFCLRALRDLAFDSGSAFVHRYVLDDDDYRRAGVTDVWRRLAYAPDAARVGLVCSWFATPDLLWEAVRAQIRRPDLIIESGMGGGQGLEAAFAGAIAALAQAHAIGRRDDVPNRLRLSGLRRDRRLPGGPANIEALAQWLAADTHAFADGDGRDVESLLALYATASVLAPSAMKKSGAPPDCAAFARAVDWALGALRRCKATLIAHVCEDANVLAAAEKAALRVISPDDVLETMRAALCRDGGERFAQRLAARFPLAMIDEFQDTDPVQWEIFSRIYPSERGGLVLIGDPKQAIFGFRGADVFAYVHARGEQARDGGGVLSLSVCRRSSAPLVAALNQMFAGRDDTGTDFLLEGVRYVPVSVPADGGRTPLYAGNVELPALTLCHLEAPDGKPIGLTPMRDAMAADAASRIRALIDADIRIGTDGDAGCLQPGQIAVLVRDRRDAQSMLRALRVAGVEAAYLNRDNVLLSEAAGALRALLAAVAQPNDEALLRTVLIGPLVTVGFDALRTRGDDAVERDVENLRRYRDVWQHAGVLVMLRHFMADYDVAQRVLAQPDGARLLTDIRHVGELLQAQSAAVPGAESLLRWLDAQVSRTAADEAEQLRLESDENLVKVVTIHGAKGLEWDVVFVPFSAPGRGEVNGVFHRRDANGSYRAVWDLLGEHADVVDAERLAEDLRLLYVAVTRARRALFLGVAFCDRAGQGGPKVPFAASALAHVLFGTDAAAASPIALGQRLDELVRSCASIVCVPVTDTPTGADETMRSRSPGAPLLQARSFSGSIDRSYRIASYSSMVRRADEVSLGVGADAAAADPGATDEGDDVVDVDEAVRPDDAIEVRFPRGAAAGVALHELLEDMARPASSVDAKGVERTLRAHGLHAASREAVAVTEWLTRVRATPLRPLSMALSDCDRTVVEMEFTLPVARLDTARLWNLLRANGYRGDPLPNVRLAGLLRGFIDLVFGHDGAYYVVDYKSNFVGRTAADYNESALARVMREHRYDLQMLLYTVALRRHLRAYGQDARVGAFYLFLRGMDSVGNGIYHHVPEESVLDAFDGLFTGAT